jgi:hypothetical protein
LIHHAIKKHKLHGTGKNKKREEIKKKHWTSLSEYWQNPTYISCLL